MCMTRGYWIELFMYICKVTAAAHSNCLTETLQEGIKILHLQTLLLPTNCSIVDNLTFVLPSHCFLYILPSPSLPLSPSLLPDSL